MSIPSKVQLQKLERLAKVIDNGDIELLNLLEDLTEKTDTELKSLYSIVNKAVSIAEQTKKLEGKRGATGATGSRGEGGDSIKGDRGDVGATGERGRSGIDGKHGKDAIAVDGERGERGEVGEKGDTGADGFVDEATVAYLEAELEQLAEQVRRGRGSMLGLGAVQREIRNKPYSETSGDYTLSESDNLVNCTGTITVTLPPASSFTGEYIIKNSGIGVVTVVPAGTETIDDETTQPLLHSDSMTIRSTKTNWIII